MEKLLEEINESEKGMTFGDIKFDVFAYADDLLILSSTKKGLKELIEIVERYGEKYEIKFNPEKTVYMVFYQKTTRTAVERLNDSWQGAITLDSEEVRKVSVMKYLRV